MFFYGKIRKLSYNYHQILLINKSSETWLPEYVSKVGDGTANSVNTDGNAALLYENMPI